MKTLHLLRHAKSAWDEPNLSDRERGLNRRGRRDAPRMGAALAGQLPVMSVAVSPARRAQLTQKGLYAGWPALAEVRHFTEEDLYIILLGRYPRSNLDTHDVEIFKFRNYQLLRDASAHYYRIMHRYMPVGGN